jgi:hypothetical protein
MHDNEKQIELEAALVSAAAAADVIDGLRDGVFRAGSSEAIRRLIATVEKLAGEDVYEMWRRVQQHPDYVFGTIFLKGDFPDGADPYGSESFSPRHAADRLAERGNEMIADAFGWSDDEADDGSEAV